MESSLVVTCITGWVLCLLCNVAWAFYADWLNKDWAEFCKKNTDRWVSLCNDVIAACRKLNVPLKTNGDYLRGQTNQDLDFKKDFEKWFK